MKALFPGSFDPVTLGHLDILERAARLCDTLTVAVLGNPSKQPLFTAVERAAFLTESLRHLPNVRVDIFSGLLADYALRENIDVIIRGVRSERDYQVEEQRALVNRGLTGGVDTLLMVSDTKYRHISSSAVREILSANGSERFFTIFSEMVPAVVAEKLKEK
ncbi:MAG: pantetheine-phosphate adenylyltransferase [Clostridiales bacterium]|jgi:pantetheine-phosphate adenylyltransferase|nr:pantetheine-phosphate adenylyltransferase [Clostridiales bacterium]